MSWRRLSSLRTLFNIVGCLGMANLVITLCKYQHNGRRPMVDGCQPTVTSNGSAPVSGASREKIILLWTSFYRDPYFGLGGLGREPFVERRCRQTNCRLTNDRTLLADASAVVIHNRHRWLRSADRVIFEKRTDDRQLFVYVGMESPLYTYVSRAVPQSCRSVFNVTMTYRLDSDVPIPYGYVARRGGASGRPSAARLGPEPPTGSADRRRHVAWLVSHRKTKSKREAYVRALSRFIPVDVYGKGANETCASWPTDRCMAMIAKRYKFYLSFENSICRDYVTEKYFCPLSYDVVPIVYGGANYRALSPPRSYIDASDFRSPRALARYLRYLSTNESAYLEYFRWKSSYDVIYFNTTAAAVADGFCRLCELVNSDYRKSYDDICDWWHNGTCAQTIFDQV